MGLTIRFDREVPDDIEQWLSSEARYIIGAFGKPYDLEKIYGPKTNEIIAECKRIDEKVVKDIVQVTDSGMRKLVAAMVRLQNGDTFFIDGKYKLMEGAETQRFAEELIDQNSPRVFAVANI
jgi:hypothetical protein